jgi:hypothetical protein
MSYSNTAFIGFPSFRDSKYPNHYALDSINPANLYSILALSEGFVFFH